jgi:hypothetical protein
MYDFISRGFFDNGTNSARRLEIIMELLTAEIIDRDVALRLIGMEESDTEFDMEDIEMMLP